MSYSAISIQGNIISSDILTKVRQEDIRFQKSADFGLDRNTPVRDEIGIAWGAARAYWTAFSARKERLKEADTGTSETRQGWIIPFMRELGYHLENAKAEIINEKSYAISHRAQNLDGFPVHIVGVRQSLDRRAEGGARLSPHALVQEYLNNCEHLYAITTNGIFLRVLRDATRLSRLCYLEFNLERIMEEELYAEFALMFRVLHATRMPQRQDAGPDSIFEFYHQEAMASGTRIRERLSESVERSIRALADGLLENHSNQVLREAVERGDTTATAYFNQLLRLVYRLLFLLVIEERNLLYADKLDEETKRKRNIYQNHYSLHRLVRLARSRAYVDARKVDLWDSLMALFNLFEHQQHASKLGLQALGSGIFAPDALGRLKDCKLSNRKLLEVLGHLTAFENEQGHLTPVNYADLDAEEFGSVYEGLLDLHPFVEPNKQGRLVFGFSAGTERKETGSYYTNHELVGQLLKTALNPLIEERLKPVKDTKERISVLLNIKVCDPACGSGHFLLAAARRIAHRLAEEVTGEENPGKEPMMQALRLVIQNCIYGVDKNPAAVELCKVALWIEGHSTGKPLSFLDHRIRPGDSLVGIDNLDRLKEGIPDGAYKETTGDDQEVAREQRDSNKEFRKSKQFDLFFQHTDFEKETKRFAEAIKALEALRGDTLEEIADQQVQYQKARGNQGWWKDYMACNLFTYAFFQEYSADKTDKDYVNSQFLAKYLSSAGSINAKLEGEALATAERVRFFHWPLEFPEIAEKGGFDVILSNPPWEKVELLQREWFATRLPNSTEIPAGQARETFFNIIQENHPDIYRDYLEAIRQYDKTRGFAKFSGRYPLCGSGRINYYSIFAEANLFLVNKLGRIGCITPPGIASDDSTKYFIQHLLKNDYLHTFYSFTNRGYLFPGIESTLSFSLSTYGKLPSQLVSLSGQVWKVEHLSLPSRVYHLTCDQIKSINPNTENLPVFQNKYDAELVCKIHGHIPILEYEFSGNCFGLTLRQGLLNMTSDKALFVTDEQLSVENAVLINSRFQLDARTYLPLYESKLATSYNHRHGTFIDTVPENRYGVRAQTNKLSLDDYVNPSYSVIPRYWINIEDVEEKRPKSSNYKWFIGFRNAMNAVADARSLSASVIPYSGVGNSMPLIFLPSAIQSAYILAVFNSFVLDYAARQKVSGGNLNFYIVKQLPVPRIDSCGQAELSKVALAVLELIYTSWDIKAFADDLWKEADDELKNAITKQWNANKAATGGHEWKLPDWHEAYSEIDWEPEKNGGCPLPPFKWNEERRALLKGELDARFALMYGLERDELRYILDPQDVYGKDFPGETFRVLQDREIRNYGEFRTRRLVLEAYDRLRPHWDMDAHLAKLKVEWEKCQVNLLGNEENEDVKERVILTSDPDHGLFDPTNNN